MISTLLTKTAFDIQIRKMKRSEVAEALNVCFKSFKESLGLSEEDVKTEIKEEMGNNFSNCYVALADGQIIGGYFLKKEKKPASDLVELGVHGLENKTGIKGVAIFVLPEYRAYGAGRQLRSIPEKLGVDYIWGQHYKELRNVENWVNFGRTYVGDKDDYAITFQEFPEVRKDKIEKIKAKIDELEKWWDLNTNSHSSPSQEWHEHTMEEEAPAVAKKLKALHRELDKLSIKK
jgi:GNAT superfamily N-acetyltransferase